MSETFPLADSDENINHKSEKINIDNGTTKGENLKVMDETFRKNDAEGIAHTDDTPVLGLAVLDQSIDNDAINCDGNAKLPAVNGCEANEKLVAQECPISSNIPVPSTTESVDALDASNLNQITPEKSKNADSEGPCQVISLPCSFGTEIKFRRKARADISINFCNSSFVRLPDKKLPETAAASALAAPDSNSPLTSAQSRLAEAKNRSVASTSIGEVEKVASKSKAALSQSNAGSDKEKSQYCSEPTQQPSTVIHLRILEETTDENLDVEGDHPFSEQSGIRQTYVVRKPRHSVEKEADEIGKSREGFSLLYDDWQTSGEKECSSGPSLVPGSRPLHQSRCRKRSHSGKSSSDDSKRSPTRSEQAEWSPTRFTTRSQHCKLVRIESQTPDVQTVYDEPPFGPSEKTVVEPRVSVKQPKVTYSVQSERNFYKGLSGKNKSDEAKEALERFERRNQEMKKKIEVQEDRKVSMSTSRPRSSRQPGVMSKVLTALGKTPPTASATSGQSRTRGNASKSAATEKVGSVKDRRKDNTVVPVVKSGSKTGVKKRVEFNLGKSKARIWGPASYRRQPVLIKSYPPGPASFKRKLVGRVDGPFGTHLLQAATPIIVQSHEEYRDGLRVIRYTDKPPPRETILLDIWWEELDDIEPIGRERLVLWQLSDREIEELRSQVLEESRHRRTEHITPVVMSLSCDEIERNYQHVYEDIRAYDITEQDSDSDQDRTEDDEDDSEIHDESTTNLQDSVGDSLLGDSLGDMPSLDQVEKRCNEDDNSTIDGRVNDLQDLTDSIQLSTRPEDRNEKVCEEICKIAESEPCELMASDRNDAGESRNIEGDTDDVTDNQIGDCDMNQPKENDESCELEERLEDASRDEDAVETLYEQWPQKRGRKPKSSQQSSRSAKKRSYEQPLTEYNLFRPKRLCVDYSPAQFTALRIAQGPSTSQEPESHAAKKEQGRRLSISKGGTIRGNSAGKVGKKGRPRGFMRRSVSTDESERDVKKKAGAYVPYYSNNFSVMQIMTGRQPLGVGKKQVAGRRGRGRPRLNSSNNHQNTSTSGRGAKDKSAKVGGRFDRRGGGDKGRNVDKGSFRKSRKFSSTASKRFGEWNRAKRIKESYRAKKNEETTHSDGELSVLEVSVAPAQDKSRFSTARNIFDDYRHHLFDDSTLANSPPGENNQDLTNENLADIVQLEDSTNDEAPTNRENDLANENARRVELPEESTSDEDLREKQRGEFINGTDCLNDSEIYQPIAGCSGLSTDKCQVNGNKNNDNLIPGNGESSIDETVTEVSALVNETETETENETENQSENVGVVLQDSLEV